ncbi:MAG: CopG family ribbon-helix-helix protein [Phreatobacter sp.]|jgi:predicted transcriptional regulator|uniref:CopG family ribbon-helix-helix protein n=1 Tax=Phreatobacter sp. TaxID=1966341 RepID=UPI004036C524
MAAGKATTTLKLDETLKERVRQLAESRQRSPHWIMREAIADYVQREEAREAFQREAMDSWRAFRETGEHLTGAEVDAWLAGWGTDDEAEAPACHE